MKTIVGCIGVMQLLLSSAVLADNHAEVTEELEERRHALIARQLELQELTEELAQNSVELAALEGLPPSIEARIRRAMVLTDRPMLGIEIVPQAGNNEPVKGVGVRAVSPGGPADQAGLEPGDIIIEIAEVPLAAASSAEAQRVLIDTLSEQTVGEPVGLKLLRDENSLEFDVTPDNSGFRVLGFNATEALPFDTNLDMVFPDRGQRLVIERYISAAERQWDGLELTELTPALGRYFGADQGLLVVRKHPLAESVPVEEGDVILKIDDREPASVDHAMRILRSYDTGESLEIAVMRDKKRRKLKMTIPDRTQAAKISQ